MSAFASRGHSHESSYASYSTGYAETHKPRELTPTEQAHAAVVECERDVISVARALDHVRAAFEKGDVTCWRDARAVLDRQLAVADKATELARARTQDATPELKEQIASAERTLVEYRAHTNALLDPPLGWTPVTREAEILAILAAPIEGSAQVGFARKEAALKAELALLSPAESRTLAERIRKRERAQTSPHDGNQDPIAAELSRMLPERRQRIVCFLADARRRDAQATARKASVQRKASAEPIADSPTAVALEATSGAGITVPHLDRIQQSFGHHDVTAVRAHVGAGATDAAHRLGARAFAIGDAVAFSTSPDLHTAAHELAHVVQQRAGVQIAGGIDSGAHDPYERHADEVADAVVRGESTEALLDRFAPAIHATPSVQRKTADSAESTAPAYVNRYRAQTMSAIAGRLAATGLPQPHPRLRWASHDQARSALVNALYRYVDAVPDHALHRLMELSYPADLLAIVDDARRAPGGSGWVPQVGIAIATAFDLPILSSIQRMGMRLRVQLDRNMEVPKASWLVASSPLDGVVANVLVQPGLALQADLTHRARSHADTPGEPFANGAREVEYEWLGARDPHLWNWIRVTSPAHATVEDVARTPFAGGEVMAGSEQAYRIAASPPYFGIPFETARLVPAWWEKAPAEVKQAGIGPRVADDAALALSTVADDAALAQAPAHERRELPLDRALERSHAQLAYLGHHLAPWIGRPPILGAVQFVERRQAELGHHPSVAKWASVAAAQERVLFAVAADVAELVNELAARGAKPGDQAIAPIIEVLRAYAHAAAVSHLPAQGRSALALARQARAVLPLAMTEQQLHFASREVATETGSKMADADAVAVASLTTRVADLRLRAARGEALDVDTADDVAADSELLATQARVGQLEATMLELDRAADEVGYTKAKFELGLPTIRALPDLLLHGKNGKETGIESWRKQLELAGTVHLEPAPALHQTDARRRIDAKLRIARSVSKQIDDFGRQNELDAWIPYAQQRIADQRMRNLINSIALQIGIMIVTGELAGAALATVRGAALTGELAADFRSASLLYKTGELAFHATLATGAQAATGGELSGRAFAENALGIALTSAAMKPFAGLLEDSGTVEKELAENASRWQKLARSAGKLAGTGAKAATELTLETAGGLGASAVARAVTSGDELSIASRQEWMTQALSLAASRFVHQRTAQMHERIAEAMRARGDARLEALLPKVDALAQRTAKPKPTQNEALAAVAERYSLLVEERAIYAELPASDRRRARNDAELRDLASHAASLATASLELSGLQPVVAGEVYEGTAEQIAHALTAAERMGIDLHAVRDPQTRVWHAKVGQRTLEIQETGRVPATSSSGLDGKAIAAKVEGVSYQPGGTFQVTTAHGVFEVTIRRTNGRSGSHAEGSGFVIEIPRGLTGADLERVIVEQLDTVRVTAIPESAARHSAQQRLDRYLGDAVGAHGLEEARSKAEAEDATTLSQQAASIRLGHARSERDMLLAIKNGEMPRYIARVGPASTHPTFANPNRAFVFATEPSDLRGLTPAEALFKVGWGRDWAKPNIDKEIEVVILDTHAAISDADNHAHQVGVGRIEWTDLKAAALADAAFLQDLKAQSISPGEAAELFDLAAREPISKAIDRVGPARAAKMEAMLEVLNARYSVNELFTGIGATMNEGGALGGREIMVRPDGTGLRLTPSNHAKVSLGIMTQADFDRVFGRSASNGAIR